MTVFRKQIEFLSNPMEFLTKTLDFFTFRGCYWEVFGGLGIVGGFLGRFGGHCWDIFRGIWKCVWEGSREAFRGKQPL